MPAALIEVIGKHDMKPGPANAIHALQRDLLENHPKDAVHLLERESPSGIAEILTRQPVSVTAPVWERLSPDIGIGAIEALSEAQALDVLQHIDPTRAAAMLSARDAETRNRFLELMPQAEADELRAILS